jgi:hypothetical protein
MTKPRRARRRPIDLAATAAALAQIVGGATNRPVASNDGDEDQNAHAP